MVERFRFALFGHPVKHSLSPVIHAAAYKTLKLPHSYSVIDVPNAVALDRAMAELRSGGLRGANVTVPHKRAVIPLVDKLAPSAVEVGAANVLAHSGGSIIAHNTDAIAFATDLADLWAGRPKLRAAVIGCGGAGLSAIVALRHLGFSVISVTSRSWNSTENMMESDGAIRARGLGALTTLWPVEEPGAESGKSSQVLRLQWRELAEQADCIVQATSAGMTGGPSGQPIADMVPWERLAPHAFAYDMIYTPRVTPFLRSARARGLRAQGGLGMLVRQAARSIALWVGEDPPLEPMRLAAEEALDRGGPG
jgi:shikimate dehydrogenase